MRKIIIAGLAILTTLGAVLAVVLSSPSGPADATTASTSASTSRPVVDLAAVSCVSASFCMAVGGQAASVEAAAAPLALIWNGAHWRRTAVNLPNGWLSGSLLSVSCTSAAYCVAAGGYSKTGSFSASIPVAVTWNGSAWTATALPRLAGGRPDALGVSCTEARHCVVAFASNPMPKSGQAFIDVLTGPKWTVHALTPPAGTEFAGFYAPSCVSVTHCVVAGILQQGRGETPLLAMWNGKALATMKAAARFPAAGFDGLSCASAKSCVAVGTWFTGPADLGYFGIWNGSIWHGARVLPQPKAMVVSSPLALSCAVPTRCLAVGYYRAPAGNYANQALAEVFNGRSWSRLNLPIKVTSTTDTDLNDVSCLSATNCVVVGITDLEKGSAYSVTAFTGFWNGKSWRLVKVS
jgi:hypothetical protein